MSIGLIATKNIKKNTVSQNLIKALLKENKVIAQGLYGASKSLIAGSLLESGFSKILILTSTQKEAEEICLDIRFFYPDYDCEVFPSWDMLPYERISPFKDIIHHRVMVLNKIITSEKIIVVAPLSSALQNIIPKDNFKDLHIEIKKGSQIDYSELLKELSHLGYNRKSMVEASGEFSAKGDILDIFPSSMENPLRIDFFDDIVERIRSFDAISQRSIEELDAASILPQREVIFEDDALLNAMEEIEKQYKDTPEASSIVEYLNNGVYFDGVEHLIPFFYAPYTLFDYMQDALAVLVEKSRLEKAQNRLIFEAKEIYQSSHKKKQVKASPDALFSELSLKIENRKILELYFLPHFEGDNVFSFETGVPDGFKDSIAKLPDFLNEKKSQGYKTVILASYEGQMRRLSQILSPDIIPAIYNELDLKKGKIKELDFSKEDFILSTASLSSGFVLKEEKLYFILDREIFGRKRSFFKKIHKVNSSPIESFLELNRGDYVVHINYGIGLFQGIERLKAYDKEKDYIKLIYADKESLYIPIEQMNLVQKYVGGSGKNPSLDKLGSKSWEKTKEKVKKALEQMAGELAKLYKARLENKGIASSADTQWQIDFEASFDYEETPDQLGAIENIKKDMEEPKCMDRLVCGDVGYGKTEVAMRACFKAVMSGLQVAVLVPTTILAEQHFETFTRRFEDFPVTIKMLSRFNTPKEVKETKAGLEKGGVDIVIGTHMLLSDSVKFKNLGFIVIDEEQKFGVRHKEKLKKFRAMVDVVSLSATPIPRTLHMSLTNIRDISIINTPPENRLPIDTYIMEFNEEIIVDAIKRETERGGQVFFVHNRVRTIGDFANYIRKLFPRLNVAVAHGQMDEHELEEIMHDFINAKTHILVSTTIVESGLDIPNANTILIDRADALGLSQLYQLRGRVGRSKRKAYCYLFYPQDTALSELAQKRLNAIREFTDLGSGFKIAMKDLEIRGAGNILGPEQSGDIASVGFELYCKLLKETVDEVIGIEEFDTFETFVDLRYDGYIPDEYISDEKQKFEIYKKIVGCVSKDDIEDIKKEIKDRFGAYPLIVESLLKLSYLKVIAKELRVASIVETEGFLNITFSPDNKADVKKLLDVVEKDKKISLNPKKPNSLTMKIQEDINLDKKLNMVQEFFLKIK